MDEEDAKLILQDLFESDEEVRKHLQRIRSIGKGYWSRPDAKEYIERLTH